MKRISYQIIFGAIILILGILLLLRTTGMYDTSRLLAYIPLLFVLLGVYALIRSGFRNIAGPIILIVIFGTIQLLVLGIISAGTIANWWPLIIILIGLGFLLNRVRRPSAAAGDAATIDMFALFGGADNVSASQSFQGGDITAIFGGADLDLRESKVQGPADIHVFAMFGGIDIRVPPDWQVRVDVLPIFGGAGDERPRKAVTEEIGKEGPDLIVAGFVAFGGIAIKD